MCSGAAESDATSGKNPLDQHGPILLGKEQSPQKEGGQVDRGLQQKRTRVPSPFSQKEKKSLCLSVMDLQ